MIATHANVSANNITSLININKQVKNDYQNNTIFNKACNLHRNIYQHQILANVPSRTMQLGAQTGNNIKTGNSNGVSYKRYDKYGTIELTNGNLENLKPVWDASAPSDSMGSDNYVNSYKIDDNVNTSKASDLSHLFDINNNLPLVSIYLGKGFDTRKACHSIHKDSDGHKHSGVYHMIPETSRSGFNSSDPGVSKLTITSPNTIFNRDSFGEANDNDSSDSNDPAVFKDIWTNAKTGKVAHLGDGKPHVGTWLYGNCHKVGVYDGLFYKYNPRTKSVKFVSGYLYNTNYHSPSDKITHNFLYKAPKILQHAASIKFGYDKYFSDGCEINSDVHSLNNMFSNDRYLKSLNLLDLSVDNSHINSMANMFSNDSSLRSLTLPDNLKNTHMNDNEAFSGDHSLTHIHILSSKSRFDNRSGLGHKWRKAGTWLLANLKDGKRHTGTWVKASRNMPHTTHKRYRKYVKYVRHNKRAKQANKKLLNSIRRNKKVLVNKHARYFNRLIKQIHSKHIRKSTRLALSKKINRKANRKYLNAYKKLVKDQKLLK